MRPPMSHAEPGVRFFCTLVCVLGESTIVRFLRVIGCSGFQNFKLKLAEGLAAGASFGEFTIHEDGSVVLYSLKTFDTTLQSLMGVRE